jgi:hypothetical protein
MKATGWMGIHLSPPAGITFHNRAFTEPVLFHLTMPPVSSGIYAILKPDPSCTPRPYRAIYFGESSNFSQRVTENHELYDDWVTEAGGIGNIYVAFCSTPFLREEQRRWAETDLIARYRPACNLKGSQAPLSYHPMLRMAK